MGAANTIQNVINTLNRVSVCGADNLNWMLGSIQTLERVKNELTEQEAKKPNDVPGQD